MPVAARGADDFAGQPQFVSLEAALRGDDPFGQLAEPGFCFERGQRHPFEIEDLVRLAGPLFRQKHRVAGCRLPVDVALRLTLLPQPCAAKIVSLAPHAIAGLARWRDGPGKWSGTR